LHKVTRTKESRPKCIELRHTVAAVRDADNDLHQWNDHALEADE